MNYNLSKVNLIMIAISFAVIILGFVEMVGEPSGEVYNPDIFSFRRITVGPMIAFLGFISLIFSILYKSKKK